MVKILLVALPSLFLIGCANHLYQWGEYGPIDSKFYHLNKNPEKALEIRQGLELHIMQVESSKQKVAPGLYAELGTMYLQEGERTKAVEMYIHERDSWPESRVFMDALIKNVTNRGSTEAKGKP